MGYSPNVDAGASAAGRGNAITQNAATSAETRRNAVAPSATRSIAAGDTDDEELNPEPFGFAGLAGKPMRGIGL